MKDYYYPANNWPENNPFHEGEVKMQRLNGVHESVMEYAPKVIRPFMPDPHRLFFEQQPFLVVAARDGDGNLWSSLLVASSPVAATGAGDVGAPKALAATSPDPKTLQISGNFARGDALESQVEQ
jgi:hypothetical protein